MSLTTEATRPAPRRDRPGRPGLEAWSWLFMRISGLALVFLALVHFSVTHIVNDVVETDARFVAERWDNPLWRLFDWSLLALALAHGVNGVRWSVEDYVRSRRAKVRLKAGLYIVTATLFAYGTYVIVAFDA